MEVENYVYSKMYASLLDGIKIHLSSRGYFLVCSDPKMYYKFSRSLANLLISCDGSKTLGQLLISNIYAEKSITEKEMLTDIMMISCLIRDGALLHQPPIIRTDLVYNYTNYYYSFYLC